MNSLKERKDNNLVHSLLDWKTFAVKSTRRK